jgi:hypothetical protein
MRAVRFLSFALLLVVGFAGAAKAQGYNNTPGTYNDVLVGVVPAMLPPGSLPSDLPKLGDDLYRGTLIVSRSGSGYSVSYQGERLIGGSVAGTTDRAKLNVNATFNSSWAGFLIGPLVVGGSLELCVVGIDGANLVSANINGVGTVDDANKRVIAKFGIGPTLTQFKVNKEPGYLR